MAKTDYVPVKLPDDAAKVENSIHLEALGVKMDLPDLGGPGVPLEIVTAYALAEGQDQKETNVTILKAFVDWFKTEQPDFWQKVKAAPNGVDWLMAVIKAWGEESDLDPKQAS